MAELVKIVVFVPTTHADIVRKVHSYGKPAIDIYPLIKDENL